MAEKSIITTMKGYYNIETRKELCTCCVCGKSRYIFIEGLNVCVGCADIIPSYIPGEQAERYLEEWTKK